MWPQEMNDQMDANDESSVLIRGARCALGISAAVPASLVIANGCVARIVRASETLPRSQSFRTDIDLSGFLVMPGFVNAHDHLQYALFPRLGNPPYRNYVEWGENIHSECFDLISRHHSVPKDVRLWWGGIRNLLCGVTTVCHHDPLWPELYRKDFPVRVVRRYGWAHSVALGGDLEAAYNATPKGAAFIIHACEGVDDQSRQEIFEIDRRGFLKNSTVLVHGLAIDEVGWALVRDRGASLIVCPSSNQFLFSKLPYIPLGDGLQNIALGSDSPLTASGDLLDESRFAVRYCGLSSSTVYRMITRSPATMLQLESGTGSLAVSGPGDLVAVRDINQEPDERLRDLSMMDVELVMIRGRVHLASNAVLERLSPIAKHGLEPLWIDGAIRWLRAPVSELMQKAEAVLGAVRLGGRSIRVPESA